jgi:peroxiredoxin
MKSMKIVTTIFLALIFLGTGGDKVSNFKLPDLQNNQVELAELLKKGPVVLDFWATWCKPCIKAFPKLDSLHHKYKAQGLTVVGINEDGPRNQAKVKPFVNSLGIDFMILIDSDNDVLRRYQVQNLPTTFLVTPDGKIASRHIGFSPLEIAKLENEVKALLTEYSQKK